MQKEFGLYIATKKRCLFIDKPCVCLTNDCWANCRLMAFTQNYKNRNTQITSQVTVLCSLVPTTLTHITVPSIYSLNQTKESSHRDKSMIVSTFRISMKNFLG